MESTVDLVRKGTAKQFVLQQWDLIGPGGTYAKLQREKRGLKLTYNVWGAVGPD